MVHDLSICEDMSGDLAPWGSLPEVFRCYRNTNDKY